MTRLEVNNKLLNILSATLRQYPDYRFGQALFNLGLVQRGFPGTILDPFFEEPQHTLERIVQPSSTENEVYQYTCNFNVAAQQMQHGHTFTSPQMPDLLFSFKEGNYVATTMPPPVADGHTPDYAPPYQPVDLPVILTDKLLNATFVKYNPPTNEESTTTNSNN